MAEFGDVVNDLVSLDDAVEAFGISRRTLNRLLSDKRLTRYRRTGDRKVYISQAELRPHLGFREMPAKYEP